MVPQLCTSRHLRPLLGLTGLLLVAVVCVLIEPPLSFEPLSIRIWNSTTSTTRTSFYDELNNTDDYVTALDDVAIWCLHLAHRLDTDQQQHLRRSPVLRAPTLDGKKLHRLPYHYYPQWKSSPLLSRHLSMCEHSMVIRLLTVFDRLCRRQGIEYMLTHGTLLGSLRHHDVIPWDTDADVMVSVKDEDRFLDAILRMNESLVLHYVKGHQDNHYYKLFLRNTPSAGGYSWNFPFIDIFVYMQNDTHVWPRGASEDAKYKRYYYPLMLRPLGELWLPSPREPRKLFDFDPFDDCKTHWYDHRNETTQDEITRKCDELKAFYPFVEYSGESNTTEVLKINNTIVHTVVFG